MLSKINKQLNCAILSIFLIFHTILSTDPTEYQHQENNLIISIGPNPLNANYSNNNIQYGFRVSSPHDTYYQNSYNTYYQGSYNVNKLLPDIQEVIGEYDFLNSFELFAYEKFCTYARTLPCYEKFILLLHDKIKNDKHFKKITAYVKGFTYSFGLWHEKSGFHDFVNEEARKIIDTRNKTAAARIKEEQQHVQVSHKKTVPRYGTLLYNSENFNSIIQNCTTQLQTCGSNSWINRLTQRAQAAEDTLLQNGQCFDYSSQVSCFDANDCYAKEFSNTYGTQLDCQLHKELYSSRYTMRWLEQRFHHNKHVQKIGPLVHYYTAQAKTEKDPLTAFALSDFCYATTQIVTQGMQVLYNTSCATGRGVQKGVKEFANPERWCNMLTGSLQLAQSFFSALTEVNEVDRRIYYAIRHKTLVRPPLLDEEKCRLEAEILINQIKNDGEETCKKLRAITWQGLVENGVAMGTTMILDAILFNLLGKATSMARCALIEQIKNAESGALLTEQCAAEVAGFGKLIIEEGPSVSAMATDTLKKDLTRFTKNSAPVSHQIHKNIIRTKLFEKIVNKIRNIGDDFLDIMEKVGGHTLARHIGKNHNKLFARSMKMERNTISTFINKKTAINAVKKNLKYNAEEIASWLMTNPSKGTTKTFDFLHSNYIGKCVLKGKKNGLTKLKASKIVLEANPVNEFGFILLTAFPTPK